MVVGWYLQKKGVSTPGGGGGVKAKKF
jgi:hypothetical protein